MTATKGYCNYPISVLEDFGDPTDDNYKEWFQIKDFLNHSEKIKIVRPIPTATIANHELRFNGTTIGTSAIKNCYNPTIAETTLDAYEVPTNISIISKNIEVYNTDVNYAYSICSSAANFDRPIFSDTDLSIFGTTLIDENENIKSYRQLATSATPLFTSNEFLLVECVKESGKLWKFNKCYVLSYLEASERYVNSQTIDYSYIIKGTLSSVIETYSKTISQCSFQSYSSTGISTDDFTLAQSDYEDALEILKAETDLKGIFSFEYDNKMNLVGSIFDEEDVFLFAGCYSMQRYLAPESFYVTLTDPLNGATGVSKDVVITVNTNEPFLDADLTSTKVWLEVYDEETAATEDLADTNILSYKTLKIIDDFKVANKDDILNSYFGMHRNNTILVGNMYRLWDDYNNCYRWIPYIGKFAGMHWEKEIKIPVDLDDLIDNNPLMFLPNEDDRTALLDNNINTIIQKKKQNYVFGNKIIHDKLIIKEIFNSGIIESIRYNFSLLQANFNSITRKQLFIERETIYNEIETLLKLYYGYISNNSISYEVDDDVLVFIITIWLKNTVQVFDIELDVELR